MIKIYNTQTRTKEDFKPVTQGEVKMYVCGVTVYDYCHLGHARGAIAFDIIRNYFEYRGYKVLYVRNFTDVDDKIINRAKKENTTSEAISTKYIEEYYKDMSALGIKKANIEPKATEHMQEIISLIDCLIKKGYAYVVEGGDVFFEVNKLEGYGKLSGRTLDEMKAGVRIEVDTRKCSPMDFALWKSSKPGEPKWATPWGEGRPGWHIECSAMAMKYLGESFDIHGGGQDLIFPHHENEIAQSEACTNKPFATYWMHNGFVNINEEKMSKSLGNFFKIREILEAFDSEIVRFFLLSTHYRSPIDFSEQHLEESKRGLDRFYTSLNLAEESIEKNKNLLKESLSSDLNEHENKFEKAIKNLKENFIKSMDDDFNTAQGVAALFEFVREMNTFLQEATITANKIILLKNGVSIIRELGNVLGIFQTQINKKDALGNEMVESLLNIIIEVRNKARAKKEWAISDYIRDKLKEQKIELEDSPTGTRWLIKK